MMRKVISVVLLLVIAYFSKLIWDLTKPLGKGEVHPAVEIPVSELVASFGYPLEIHKVTTEDGYILELHRIPYGIKSTNKTRSNRPSVLVNHGMAIESRGWFIPGPEHGYPFFMAEHGYDVWLMNIRGHKTFSRHIKYDIEKDADKFYNFTQTDVAIYDISASINYIIEKTGQSKIFYTGHSQSTCLMFVLLSERPEYNEKIHAAAMFAPVMYGSKMSAPFVKFMKSSYNVFKWFVETMGLYTFEPFPPFVRNALVRICGPYPEFCLNYVVGPDNGVYTENVKLNWVPLLMQSFPLPSGIKALIHMTQNAIYDRFQYYDYGSEKNLEIYGTTTPKLYDVEKITAPLALYFSKNDKFTHPVDIERLKKSVSNIIEAVYVPDNNFTHMNFMMGLNAKEILYPRVIQAFAKYL